MASTKMTKKEILNAILSIEAIQQNETYRNFISHEIELLEKKAGTKSGKPTKQQVENDRLRAIILDVVTNANEPLTVSDIQNAHEELNPSVMTSQRAIALISSMAYDPNTPDKNPNGVILKTYIKKKPYYSIRPTETAEN